MNRTKKAVMAQEKTASIPTIRRLPSYLHIVRQAREKGTAVISGTVIANELDLEPIQVRKDLAVTGIIGKPRVGYQVEELIQSIESFLNWNRRHRAIVAGAGNLGQALMGYAGFVNNGLDIIAAYDIDPVKIGTEIHGKPVRPLQDLECRCREEAVDMAILCVPWPAAQDTADVLVQSGIKAIWNFTNIKLKVPQDVLVQREDLTSGYAIISVFQN